MVFDTETSGLVSKKQTDLSKQPHIIQYAHAIIDTDGKYFDVEEVKNKLFKIPIKIPKRSMDVHGITDERIKRKEAIFTEILGIRKKMEEVDFIVGHNVTFDMNMVWLELSRVGGQEEFIESTRDKLLDTMKVSKQLVQATDKNGRLKYPRLDELYVHFFGEDFENSHDALADVDATLECFKQLVNENLIDLGL